MGVRPSWYWEQLIVAVCWVIISAAALDAFIIWLFVARW